jgi:threonine/homoserine/homoserine lactone efflux protein
MKVHVDIASLLTLLLVTLYLAVQPSSLLAAIILATASNGSKKALAYLGGRVTALVVVAITAVLVYPDIPHGSNSPRSRGAVELGVGILIGGWLLWRLRNPKDAGREKKSSWTARLDTMSPLLAFGLGALLPSYLAITAAVDEMVSSGLSQGWLLLVALAWVLLASTGAASPLWPLVSDRQHAPETYERWRTWITTHRDVVLYAVGALVSVVLTGKGLVGLIG